MTEIVKKATEVLQNGGLILYPTDTIWGIGCDATNATAVERIYKIKQRDRSKSMLILIPSGTYTHPLSTATGRPTTFIVPTYSIGHEIADNLAATDGTIGIRMPRHRFCESLLEAFGKPIVSTSANFSGLPSPASAAEIDPKLKTLVDYCVPALAEFESGEPHASRIIKITDNGIVVIRD